MNRALRAIYGVGEFNEYREPGATAVRGRPRKIECARNWLQGFLKDEEKPVTDVRRAGKAAGFSERTLERAKRSAGVWSVLVREPATGKVTEGRWRLEAD